MSEAVWGNLIKNKFYQNGGKQPALVSYKTTVNITEAGEYTVSIWAPRDGKNTYSMKLTKVEPQEGEQSNNESKPVQQQQVRQASKPVENKPSNPKSLFKR